MNDPEVQARIIAKRTATLAKYGNPLKGRKRPFKKKSKEHVRKVGEAIRRFHQKNPGFFAGENNPNWKGGTTGAHRTRLTRAKWKKLRLEIIKRDGYTCQECDAQPELSCLHVHHIVPWRDGGQDVPDNLITLCNKCHMWVESIARQGEAQDAITEFCKQCMGDQVPKDCTSPMCPLYPFRLGKGHTGRKGNAENLR